jgi:dipeptidyl aminopeptidase/acylaminoacyl peptidase
MRLVFTLLLLLPLHAEQFTLDQILSAPFPSELTASPTGAKVAWFSNARGVRNLRVAEPPAYTPHSITSYTEDDGQELTNLRWTPDSSAIVYVRGGAANPALSLTAPASSIYLAPLDSTAPHRIGEGESPAISPKGDRVAFLRHGQLWIAPLDGTPTQLFQSRTPVIAPVWSPDASRIAFTSLRGDHTLIGVFDFGTNAVRYLDPGTDNDTAPEWSPDGRSIAFLRWPSNGLRPIRQAAREGEPWAIRVVDAATGTGREIFCASPGPGSVFRTITARNQILWSGDRIIFPWEQDGWTHLYSVPAAGGKPTLLTPGDFEVEDATLSANGSELIYSSNQSDIDRRHLWKVPVSGGTPTALTKGETVESSPAAEFAYLQSDARRPLHPVVAGRHLDAPPPDFPLDQLAVPQQVVFKAADGLAIHGQLFLPARPTATRLPAIVFFHGGSRRQMLLGWHSMYYYHNAYAFNQYLASLGYAVLSVNYRSGIGYGLNFREALHYGPSGASEYADVKAAALYLRARSDIDPARIAAWGGSYGGYLTALALARNSDLFKTGVDFHGVHDWARELMIPAGAPDYQLAFDSSPLAFVKTWHSPVLLIAGDNDPDVQFNQTVMLADALRKQGVQIEELIFPEEVHDFLLYRTWKHAYEAAAQFLRAHL